MLGLIYRRLRQRIIINQGNSKHRWMYTTRPVLLARNIYESGFGSNKHYVSTLSSDMHVKLVTVEYKTSISGNKAKTYKIHWNVSVPHGAIINRQKIKIKMKKKLKYKASAAQYILMKIFFYFYFNFLAVDNSVMGDRNGSMNFICFKPYFHCLMFYIPLFRIELLSFFVFYC